MKQITTMYSHYLLIFVNIVREIYWVSCTIDVNLSELEYIAAHLDIFECRRLIAALHYTSYELPQNMAGAIRKVDESISCLGHLLHWNNSPSEGRGQTHQHLVHRLRQINRNDLANWLGETVFEKLGDDLREALDKPFDKSGEQITKNEYPSTMVLVEDPEEEHPWQLIDGLLIVFLVSSSICLLLLILAIAVRRITIQNSIMKNDVSRSNKEIIYSDEEDYLLDSEVDK